MFLTKSAIRGSFDVKPNQITVHAFAALSLVVRQWINVNN